MESVLDAAKDVLVNLLAAGLLALAAAAWAWNRRLRARSLWPFRGDKFTAVLATSSTQSTGIYMRPASGIGQIRALAILVPSILRAWRRRVDVSDVMLSADVTSEIDNDLVLLGGPKNNKITHDFLARVQGTDGAPNQIDSIIYWEGAEYSAKLGEGVAAQEDFGLILRWKNPHDPQRTVILLSGASTYGTIAAALWYVGQRDPTSEQESKSLMQNRYFTALVRSPVTNGRVGVPVLLKGSALE